MNAPLTLFWFRRDLRLDDNIGLYESLKDSQRVQGIFIFDTEILLKLKNPLDRRVTFIHQQILAMKQSLQSRGADLWVYYGQVEEVISQILAEHKVAAVYANHDYEPDANKRDQKVSELCQAAGVQFRTFKDQVIFEKSEVLTDAGKPYTVFTPYKKKWLSQLKAEHLRPVPVDHFIQHWQKSKPQPMLELSQMGFSKVLIEFPEPEVSSQILSHYQQDRDFPGLLHGTSRMGLHFRFGTVSIREWAREAKKNSETWLSELIWREFFMQILWHFPYVVKKSFRPDYDKIAWRTNQSEFEKWTEGRTGFAMVDAGMRELAATGHMHNRVRMVVASFLCKHLLMHWYLGERFFAAHLLDYDLSANNGNWQWAAGSGCDAAPYFRVFNPMTQAEKFDPDEIYIRRWIPEFGTINYPKPMVDHAEARGRCLQAYQKALKPIGVSKP